MIRYDPKGYPYGSLLERLMSPEQRLKRSVIRDDYQLFGALLRPPCSFCDPSTEQGSRQIHQVLDWIVEKNSARVLDTLARFGVKIDETYGGDTIKGMPVFIAAEKGQAELLSVFAHHNAHFDLECDYGLISGNSTRDWMRHHGIEMKDLPAKYSALHATTIEQATLKTPKPTAPSRRL